MLEHKVTTLPLNLLCIKHRNIRTHQDLVLSHHPPQLARKTKNKTGWKTGPSRGMAGYNSTIIAALATMKSAHREPTDP